ncbi:uncharacterized protein LOC108027993 [Drosophila biarmipes]|uniref:uncharacterized protein LOC108027993 n=1 Tax=Drosophila biarmipes TaxID=125945 RepID=UPI0021CCE9F9|nr:uncharacterized protein LOC108027993 [Drosophila biarmipes]
MKTPNVSNLWEEPQGSSLELSTHSINFNSESEGEVKNERNDCFKINKRNLRKIKDLEARLAAAEKEKTRLYEVLIGEKDNLIKSLHFSIGLITETKNSTIKQLQSQIDDLHNALDLKHSLKENSTGETPANFVANDISEERQLSTMMKQRELLNQHIVQLELKVQEKDALIANFESKVEEMEIYLERFKEKSKREEDGLKTKISELEKTVSIASTKLREKEDNQLKQASLNLNLTRDSRIFHLLARIGWSFREVPMVS